MKFENLERLNDNFLFKLLNIDPSLIIDRKQILSVGSIVVAAILNPRSRLLSQSLIGELILQRYDKKLDPLAFYALISEKLELALVKFDSRRYSIPDASTAFSSQYRSMMGSQSSTQVWYKYYSQKLRAKASYTSSLHQYQQLETDWNRTFERLEWVGPFQIKSDEYYFQTIDLVGKF